MVARGAGDLLRNRFHDMMGGAALRVTEKGPGDFVTQVDREVEDWILEELGRLTPGVAVLSEEHYQGQERPPTCWIVDPLDGTRGFIHGLPHFAVALAFVEDGEVAFGVTYAPIEEEMFHSEKSGGVWCNGCRVFVSRVDGPSGAMVALGLPFKGKKYLDPFLLFYRSAYEKGMALRHTGSAALDLCYVACGRYDGLFYLELSPWDVAGGGLMVQEGGGMVEGLGGKDWLDGWILASNQSLYPLLSAIAKGSLG
jgi:myo-inositol-1(or 4)-monophosphatase